MCAPVHVHVLYSWIYWRNNIWRIARKRTQLTDINLVVMYDRHAFSGSLRGWCNIGRFNLMMVV